MFCWADEGGDDSENDGKRCEMRRTGLSWTRREVLEEVGMGCRGREDIVKAWRPCRDQAQRETRLVLAQKLRLANRSSLCRGSGFYPGLTARPPCRKVLRTVLQYPESNAVSEAKAHRRGFHAVVSPSRLTTFPSIPISTGFPFMEAFSLSPHLMIYLTRFGALRSV